MRLASEISDTMTHVCFPFDLDRNISIVVKCLKNQKESKHGTPKALLMITIQTNCKYPMVAQNKKNRTAGDRIVFYLETWNRRRVVIVNCKQSNWAFREHDDRGNDEPCSWAHDHFWIIYYRRKKESLFYVDPQMMIKRRLFWSAHQSPWQKISSRWMNWPREGRNITWLEPFFELLACFIKSHGFLMATLYCIWHYELEYPFVWWKYWPMWQVIPKVCQKSFLHWSPLLNPFSILK